MTYIIVFTPEANSDLTDILGWYNENTSPEIKKKFIGDVSKLLKSLEKSPKAYSIRLKNSRCAVLKKYPYNIYYWVDDIDSTVNVFAILHQKRNPAIWRDRI
jgi:plasmid stabilization system protein ParE